MSPDPVRLALVDIVILGAFFGLLLVLGVVLSRAASRGLEDYFLGGRRLPWWLLGVSTATSNFDMSGTMVIVALVFALGYQGFLVELRGGVGLALALLLVFVARWLNRSRVMTSAEWMKLRFGTDRQGRAAHQLSAVANILLSLGMIIYFAKGAGKFVTAFVPVDETAATATMVAIGLVYTLAAGLYGVVFTDLLQMVILVGTAIYVAVLAFQARPNVDLPPALTELSLSTPAGDRARDLLATNPEAWGPIFELFEVAVVMWTLRSIIEGLSGVSGYTDQRFFAARDERSAVLVCAQSIVLSFFRWTMVAGLVVLAYDLLAAEGPAAELISRDPEQVLPAVLGRGLPAGIRGLVIAGLVAAAMSTFDSTLNAGAAFIVRDLYQSYWRPNASERRLVWMSRVSTVLLCLVGVLLAAIVPSINRVWAWIQMGLGAGLFTPLFLRWYWPRLNGFGFAGGTAGGLVAALLLNAGTDLPVFISFPVILVLSLAASVAVAKATAPTPDATLVAFFAQVRPAGWWRRVRRLAVESGALSTASARAHRVEVRNAAFALPFAMLGQLGLLLAGMAFVFHDWAKLPAFSAAAVTGGLGVAWFLFRKTPGPPSLDRTAETRAEERP